MDTIEALILSERAYVQDLEMLLNVYIRGLLDDVRQPKPVLFFGGQAGGANVVVFLGSVERIHTLNREFCQALEVDRGAGCVAEVMHRFAPLFRMYSHFAANHSTVTALINEKMASTRDTSFREWARGCEQRCETEYPLPSDDGAKPAKIFGHKTLLELLEMPTMRIDEYCSAAQRLLDATASNDPVFVALRRAHRDMTDTCAHISRQMKAQHARLAIQRLESLWGRTLTQPGRYVIKEGSLTKVSRGRDIQYQFVLFSDAVMYGAAQIGSWKVRHHRTMSLKDMLIDEIAPTAVVGGGGGGGGGDDASAKRRSISPRRGSTFTRQSLRRRSSCGGPETTQSAFQINHPSKSFVVYAASVAEHNEWMAQLDAALSKHKAASLSLDTHDSTAPDFDSDVEGGVGRESEVEVGTHAPVWQCDQDFTNCSNCECQFSVYRRRHHCRRCGEVICGKCSSQRFPLNQMVSSCADTKLARACDRCARRMQIIAEERMKEGGAFGSDRPIDSERFDSFEAIVEAAEGQIAGLLSSSAAAAPAPAATKSPRRRVVDEILKTETTYLGHLRSLLDVYVAPILADADSARPTGIGSICGVTSPDNVTSMSVFFHSVENMATLHSRLLKELQRRIFGLASGGSGTPGKRSSMRGDSVASIAANYAGEAEGGEVWDDASSTLGDIFSHYGPLFTIYSEYSDQQMFASRTIDDYIQNSAAFSAFVEAGRANERCEGQDLSSFLIMPIQRVPRYQLLLQELLKQTTKMYPDPHVGCGGGGGGGGGGPQQHPDVPLLEEALGKVASSAMHINERIRQRENKEKIIALERQWGGAKLANPNTNRLFLREGTLDKQCRRGPKRFRFLLFSDCLIYGSVLTGSGIASETQFTYHRQLPMSQFNVSDITSSETAFKIESTKSFVIIAPNSALKDEWLHALQECLKKYREIHRHEVQELAAVWVPDSEASHCSICNTAFSVFKRRHHCRKCGRVGCAKCLAGRMLLPHIDPNRHVRCCSICKNVDPNSADEAAESRDIAAAKTGIDAMPSLAYFVESDDEEVASGGALDAFTPPKCRQRRSLRSDSWEARRASEVAVGALNMTEMEARRMSCGSDQKSGHVDAGPAHGTVVDPYDSSDDEEDDCGGGGGLLTVTDQAGSAAAAGDAVVGDDDEGEGQQHAFPLVARALFAYVATGEGEAAIDEEDIIVVTEASGPWWLGESARGSIGWIPKDYVEVVREGLTESEIEEVRQERERDERELHRLISGTTPTIPDPAPPRASEAARQDAARPVFTRRELTSIMATARERGGSWQPPPGYDGKNCEQHLADDEFARTFDMTKAAFAQLPTWRKERLKKDKGLW